MIDETGFNILRTVAGWNNHIILNLINILKFRIFFEFLRNLK